ncbi:hypothetical protein LTR10_022489 [Elasticomyces elasticus]|uniref:Major facilitator superfamily (MFS) profile domain-containing protein n=1 Tax=Exophiala sideris TaxID=1016849 RepID=A0ABR0J147_9EURO|nr:hypothetical protein LTR10_022489 [Elasticomyces elasticus]KAK5024371.1 hypothetical protein LTS07_008662 [Exophiala sideris]KAK5030947.1 hypothetical protein LTR13_007960 [Exophiala sideris]KAK5054104.1 hypothetical protein LTR69_009066 [Exophiala sideris]KAK5179540.1 hypothetical protein LTR44_008056 [Eurotiomycetes sp. CCFEE 6388]
MAGNRPSERGRQTSRNQTGRRNGSPRASSAQPASSDQSFNEKSRPKIERWTLGILNDKETEEVPGTVLLLSAKRNEPLGLEHQQARRSSSSMPPQPMTPRSSRRASVSSAKRTKDGQIILNPQPDDSLNDPLNWSAWRRDSSLLSLGFYCMLGGGMTPILAAGFNNVAQSFHVSYQRVALTTGLYMMGLGVGSVIFSPTAILFGKRPVYLASAVMFILTSIWCALAPDYANLATARVFQGISVSPVECLPSATIAEIFFLHERAFRVGIYTLLLLGGKNLVPLVSAAIIGAKGWRWVFWIVAMVVGFGFCVLFFFVPETFWDRPPKPKSRRPTAQRSLSSFFHHPLHHTKSPTKSQLPEPELEDPAAEEAALEKVMTPRQHRLHEQNAHARFEDAFDKEEGEMKSEGDVPVINIDDVFSPEKPVAATGVNDTQSAAAETGTPSAGVPDGTDDEITKIEQPDTAVTGLSARRRAKPTGLVMPLSPDMSMYKSQTEPNKYTMPWDGTMNGKPVKFPTIKFPNIAEPGAATIESDASVPHLHNLNSPYYMELEKSDDYLDHHPPPSENPAEAQPPKEEITRSDTAVTLPESIHSPANLETSRSFDDVPFSPRPIQYTSNLRRAPPKSYIQTLKPWNGRFSKANWFLVACRPFVLFLYPSVLWSSLVYSLSIGWLIVLSESISNIYRSRDTYNFSALGAGLVYISPFVGGILGTAVAGKVSDIIVRYMARRNGGVYEPEFRLVMAIPVALSTAIGLMGYGWSAQERDKWIVPTIFFGIISFGCSLGSTTAITFCVDSYRQYAGEALVTLNFSKNIFHGLVFSLFFATWLEDDGPKTTFIAIGAIQIACLLTTIPMYIYGKRGRMWTVRKGFMEKF